MRPRIIFCLCFLGIGCGRKAETTVQPPHEPAQELKVGIHELPWMYVAPGTSVSAPIEVWSTGGAPAINLRLSGLPAGIDARFSPSSGTPPFTTRLIMTASTAAATGYFSNVTLTLSSARISDLWTSRVPLTVRENCAALVVGTYRATDSCDNSGPSSAYTFRIEPDTTMRAIGPGIRLINFAANSGTIFGGVNCSGRIDFYYQSNGVYTILGRGVYTDSSISLVYDLWDITTNSRRTCTSMSIRQ